MAEQLLFTYTVIKNAERGGTFTHLQVGGQFSSYYNDSTGNIIVRDNADNSVLTTSDFPADFILNVSGETSVSNATLIQGGFTAFYLSNYQFCDGLDLNQYIVGLWASYPFATPYVTQNDSSCQVGSTCDLVITSVEVTNETGTGNADGSITVTATTTQANKQYSLSLFNFGEGQSSNVFSGLTAGDYTVYVRDDLNCLATANVTVINQSAGQYNTIYRVGYKDINGNAARFDIEKYEYSGAITEVTSGGDPVVYVQNEIDQFDVFGVARPSYINVTLHELTKFEYLDLININSNREYRGRWYKDTGSGYLEQWRGYLEPITFSGSYNWQPSLTLTFTDQINNLQRKKYGRGNIFYNDKKLIKIIADLLKDTDLELPIHVGINMYEDSHSSAASDDPLDQTFIDQETFYNADDGTGKPYSEVLDIILRPFGVKMFQWQGAWWIIRVEELVGSFDYRVFNKSGNYVSNSSYNPLKELRRACITDARATWIGGSQNIEVLKAPSNFIIPLNFDPRESILENYSFERVSGGFNNPVNWTRNIGDGGLTAIQTTEQASESGTRSLVFNYSGFSDISSTYQRASQKNIQYRQGDKIKVNFKIGVDNISDVVPYIIVRMMIKVGSNYLQEDGTWDSAFALYRKYVSPGNGFIDVNFEEDFPDTNVTVDTTLDFRIYAYRTNNADFGYIGTTLVDGETDFRASNTADSPLSKIVSVYADGLSGTGTFYMFFYRLQEGTDAESLPDIVRPNDYAASTNERVWKLEKFFSMGGFTNQVTNDRFYVDDVVIDVLPGGQDAQESVTINAENGQFSDDYEYVLNAGDLPDVFISSAKYTNNNFFKLSDGTNTQNWTRDGSAESQTLQKILAKQIIRQYSTNTFKLTGTISTNNEGAHLDITPLDSLVETQDDGKIYYINGITINDKALEYEVQLVHSKANTTFSAANGFCEIPDAGGGTDDGGGDGGSYSGGFTSGFGAGFTIIFN